MKAERWPLPKTEDIFDYMMGAIFFSSLDVFNAYWQLLISTCCKELMTFVCKFGAYAFDVMQFRLMNALETYQKAMDEILYRLPFVRVYLDDIVIFSKTIEEHLEHIGEVLDRISKYNITLKITRCDFIQANISLLCHVVGRDDVKVDEHKIEEIQQIKAPTSTTEVRSFSGLAGYYRHFIRGFSDIAAPLNEATSTKKEFHLTAQTEEAFVKLKRSLVTPPVLSYSDFKKHFIM